MDDYWIQYEIPGLHVDNVDIIFEYFVTRTSASDEYIIVIHNWTPSYILFNFVQLINAVLPTLEVNKCKSFISITHLAIHKFNS